MNAPGTPSAGRLTPELLELVAARAEREGLSEAAICALRRAWPGIHFTWCGEDDVPVRVKPARTGAGFAIYLVSGADHCVAFTDRLETATGLVLAVPSAD